VVVLRIEHPVPNFNSWKREGFDRDPIGRAQGGVRRYRILRSTEDPDVVNIDLEFDNKSSARAFSEELTAMWSRVRDGFAWREIPRGRIFEIVETGEY